MWTFGYIFEVFGSIEDSKLYIHFKVGRSSIILSKAFLNAAKGYTVIPHS